MNSIKIEIAGEQDSEVIREIYQTAFPEEESAMVAKLAVDLLAEKTVPEILSLVAREIETTLGHVAFSPVKVNIMNLARPPFWHLWQSTRSINKRKSVRD